MHYYWRTLGKKGEGESCAYSNLGLQERNVSFEGLSELLTNKESKTYAVGVDLCRGFKFPEELKQFSLVLFRNPYPCIKNCSYDLLSASIILEGSCNCSFESKLDRILKQIQEDLAHSLHINY